MKGKMTVMLIALLLAAGLNMTSAQDNAMSFFLTSAGPGNGADLGGLDGADGSAHVGHHDRLARGEPGSPWNVAHPSRDCSQENLQGTGGDGLFYCIAVD